MTGTGRLRYEPALDGIRGVAVAAVLCFHAGFGWAKGGFLGVSVFFTLSGYLITSLLLAEHRDTSGLSLRRFWSRRARRLLPASLLCIAGVVVLAATVLEPAQARLHGDALGALADVANWRFYFAGDSYAGVFAVPSPLTHFWSLAIEEQFYVLFPPLVWWLLVRRRATTRTLGAVLAGGLVAATVAAVLIGRSDADLAYYATFTRAAELLAGCLLAVILHRLGPPNPQLLDAGPGWAGLTPKGSQLVRTSAAGAGLVALAGFVALAATTEQTAGWLYRGGLPAFSGLSAALVVGALVPGPLRAALSAAPLVALGKISYGVYLFHWPVDLVLTPARTELAEWPLFALRVAVTLAVAIASYRLLELPIRHGKALRGWSARLAPIGVAVAVLTGALAVGASAQAAPSWTATANDAPLVTLPPLPSSTASVAPTTSTTEAPTTTVVTRPEPTPLPTEPPTTGATAPPAPVRIVVFGDSTARVAAAGLIQWGADTGLAEVSDVGTNAGCGIVRPGSRQYGGEGERIPDECQRWPDEWPEALADNPADVAVLLTGPFDMTDHQLPGDDTWRGPGNPAYDELLLSELGAATDALLATGTPVVWVTTAEVNAGWFFIDDPIDDPARATRLNEIIGQVAADRPGVTVVDLAAWLAAQPGDIVHNPDLRPDGVHFTPEASRDVAAWLGPAIIDALP